MISSTISLLSCQRLSFWSSLRTLGTNFAQILRISSSLRIIVCTVPTLTSNCALIASIDTRRFLSMKIFIWPINSGVLISYSSHTPHHPSQTPWHPWIYHATQNWSLLHARGSKSSLKHSIRFWGIFPSLKQNFIAYRSSKMSSHPDSIFEIPQLWQSGFSKVYSDSYCSCSFKAEIIKKWSVIL